MGKFFKWSFFAKRFLPVVGAIMKNRLHFKRSGRSPVLEALVGRRGVLKDNQALGILIGAGIEVGQGMYNRPGFQATMSSVIDKATGGEGENSVYLSRVDVQADWIVAQLHASFISLQRIAVDGVPGSGKTTLARILAKKLNMQWKSLDHMRTSTCLWTSRKSRPSTSTTGFLGPKT